MAFSSLAVNAGGLLNQFAWPVALANIGWKTYIVFIVWCAIQTVVWYFFLPETRKRTVSFRNLVPWFRAFFLTVISLHSSKNSTRSSRPRTPSSSRSRLISWPSTTTTKSLLPRKRRRELQYTRGRSWLIHVILPGMMQLQHWACRLRWWWCSRCSRLGGSGALALSLTRDTQGCVLACWARRRCIVHRILST